MSLGWSFTPLRNLFLSLPRYRQDCAEHPFACNNVHRTIKDERYIVLPYSFIQMAWLDNGECIANEGVTLRADIGDRFWFADWHDQRPWPALRLRRRLTTIAEKLNCKSVADTALQRPYFNLNYGIYRPTYRHLASAWYGVANQLQICPINIFEGRRLLRSRGTKKTSGTAMSYRMKKLVHI